MGTPQNPDRKPYSDAALRYTSLAFQLIGIILIGALIGSWIDNKFGTANLGKAFSTLLFVIIGLVYCIRDIINSK